MNIYNKIYLVLLLIALISYLVAFRKKELYIKLLIGYMGLLLLTLVASVYATNIIGVKNNLIIFHIATPFEYLFLGLLYYQAIINATARKLVLVSIPVFIALSVFFSLFVQHVDENNSYAIIAEAILVITWSLFYLREIMLLQHITVLHRYSLFWITVGLLFFFTGTLFTQGMLNYLITNDMQLARSIYRVSHIFEYLLFILFIAGAYCKTGLKKPVTNDQKLSRS